MKSVKSGYKKRWNQCNFLSGCSPFLQYQALQLFVHNKKQPKGLKGKKNVLLLWHGLLQLRTICHLSNNYFPHVAANIYFVHYKSSHCQTSTISLLTHILLIVIQLDRPLLCGCICKCDLVISKTFFMCCSHYCTTPVAHTNSLTPLLHTDYSHL